MKKFFKNSSLVTNTFNRLNINTIECDELKNPLITRDEWKIRCPFLKLVDF